MQNYKQIEFLSSEDIMEEYQDDNNVYFDFSLPSVQQNYNQICDYLLNNFIPNKVLSKPVEGNPIFFQIKPRLINIFN